MDDVFKEKKTTEAPLLSSKNSGVCVYLPRWLQDSSALAQAVVAYEQIYLQLWKDKADISVYLIKSWHSTIWCKVAHLP